MENKTRHPDFCKCGGHYVGGDCVRGCGEFVDPQLQEMADMTRESRARMLSCDSEKLYAQAKLHSAIARRDSRDAEPMTAQDLKAIKAAEAEYERGECVSLDEIGDVWGPFNDPILRASRKAAVTTLVIMAIFLAPFLIPAML